MRSSFATSFTYVLAAVFSSMCLLGRIGSGPGVVGEFVFWLIAGGIPVFFVFAYTRALVSAPTTHGRLRHVIVLHGALAASAALVFTVLSRSRENPARDLSDFAAMAVIAALIAVLTLLLISPMFLLLKGNSSLAAFASIVFWPYWFLLSLLIAGRWFRGAGVHPELFLLALLAPICFASAGGVVPHNRGAADILALLGIVGAPWLYWNVIKDSGLGNVWLVFNEPGKPLGIFSYQEVVSAALAIASVAFLTLAVATAAVRLLPGRWQLGRVAIREQGWLPLVICFVILAVWFSRSVLPYRIPGALDYSDYPMLQILHVQKSGLQYHERCVNVWGRRGQPVSVSFSGDDRRLLQYRFQELRESGGELSQPLAARIHAFISSTGEKGRWSDPVKPLWAWQSERWYISGRSGLRVYPSPPAGVVELFTDLENLPRSSRGQWELKDVCLGFCFDPLPAMGLLFANHRCFNEGHGTICR